MKSTEISGKKAVSLIAVTCLCLVILLEGGNSSLGYIDKFANYLDSYLGFKIEPQNQEKIFTPDQTSFTVPTIPEYSPQKNELKPILRTRLQPGFSLSCDYKYSDFFRGGVSYFKINIKNEGRNSIFISRYGVTVNASENLIYSKDCGAFLSPGEEKSLEALGVQVPDEKNARFCIVLWILACTSEGKWHEYEPYFLNEFTTDLKPMPELTNSVYQYDPAFNFNRLNQLVEPYEPNVRSTAKELSLPYPDSYNIYQICAIFDYVREKIKYVSDPRGRDFWATANITLKIGAGDCDDKAILISSMIEAVGGTTRIYLTDTHAFAAVYLGNGTKAIEAAVKGIRAYYGNVDMYYLTDKYGSWLILDPTSSFYAGGLPGTAVQAKVQVAGREETYNTWAFVNTSEVEVIDISPGKRAEPLL